MLKFKDFINEKQTDRKYELIGQEGKFWRIRALKGFECVDGTKVKAGDIGGLIKSEDNLSQEGNCWVAKWATVSGKAKVFDNAKIGGEGMAFVGGHAKVYGNAQVYGYAIVRDNAEVTDDSRVGGPALIIRDNAKITGDSNLFGRYNVDWDIDSVEIDQGQWPKKDPKLMNK